MENLLIEGELLPAIGRFKCEPSKTYLQFNPFIGSLEVGYEQDAVNIINLDKRCIVFNTEADKGYRVAAIDSNGKADNT